MLTGKIDEEVREIDFAEGQSDRWHDDAFDKRGNYFSERGADYYCNCQVDHISPRDELLEFFPHGCVLLFLWSVTVLSCFKSGLLCFVRCLERHFVCFCDLFCRLAAVGIVSLGLLVADYFSRCFSALSRSARLC